MKYYYLIKKVSAERYRNTSKEIKRKHMKFKQIVIKQRPKSEGILRHFTAKYNRDDVGMRLSNLLKHYITFFFLSVDTLKYHCSKWHTNLTEHLTWWSINALPNTLLSSTPPAAFDTLLDCSAALPSNTACWCLQWVHRLSLTPATGHGSHTGTKSLGKSSEPERESAAKTPGCHLLLCPRLSAHALPALPAAPPTSAPDTGMGGWSLPGGGQGKELPLSVPEEFLIIKLPVQPQPQDIIWT